jgi:hypothetical protein
MTTRNAHSGRGAGPASLGLALALALAVLAFSPSPGPDPSGVWESDGGSLSLLLAGDDLAFSYTAVFGPAAHICEGMGLARRAPDGSFIYRDAQGSAVFLAAGGEVRLQPGQGVIAFCGANWPGGVFPGSGFKPAATRRVKSERAYFHAVGPLPPRPRTSYVIAGDAVETVPLQEPSAAKEWVLARYRGPRSVTMGLLRRSDLDPESR